MTMIRKNYDAAAGFVEPHIMLRAQIGRLKEELHVQIRYIDPTKGGYAA
jgi:hypothetical protein